MIKFLIAAALIALFSYGVHNDNQSKEIPAVQETKTRLQNAVSVRNNLRIEAAYANTEQTGTIIR